MSLVAMTRSAARGNAFRSGMTFEATSGKAESAVTAAIEKVATYIPSEVTTLYIAGFGLLVPLYQGIKWWLLGICVPLVWLFVWLGNPNTSPEPNIPTKKLPPRDLAILSLLGTFAFCSWAAAIPETPFLDWGTHATQIGGFMVVACSLLMPRVARGLKVGPP